MPIQLSSNFHLATDLPLDSKTIQATLVTRDAIPAIERFQGLQVFVTAEQKNYQLVGGILNANWVEVAYFPEDSILEWTNNKYQPFTTPTVGAFDTSASAPGGTTRLNYGGYLYATRLYDGGTRVSVSTHNHTGTYEAVLGAPGTNNQILISSTLGVRSWSTINSLLPKATSVALGAIKVGPTLEIDGNGVLDVVTAGPGGILTWGGLTGDIVDQDDLMDVFDLYAPLISPSLVTPLLGTPTSGNLSNCTFPTLNQDTTGHAGSATKLVTPEFTVEQTGTGGTAKLLIKLGATPLVSVDHLGNLTSIIDIVAYGSV